MMDIYVRNLNDETSKTLAAIAGGLGMSKNDYICFILDQHVKPYMDLRRKIVNMAKESGEETTNDKEVGK